MHSFSDLIQSQPCSNRASASAKRRNGTRRTANSTVYACMPIGKDSTIICNKHVGFSVGATKELWFKFICAPRLSMDEAKNIIVVPTSKDLN